MKRLLLLIIVLILFFPALYAKGGGDRTDNGKLKVISTVFPSYDFVRQIAGGRVNLSMLLPPGAESHSYEPAPRDIINIQKCDVFIYTGGDSDAWVDRILGSMDTANMKIVRLMDTVEVVEEEIVEGMEDDHGHDHAHEHADFDPADVRDRNLSEWNGSWSSVHLQMNDASFNPYFEARSRALELSLAETREDFARRWKTAYPEISISGNTVTFSGGGKTASAEYRPSGYQVVETSSGAHRVWYHYETSSSLAPRRIIINDHGYKPGGASAHDHDDDDDHDHAHNDGDQPPHFHLKYGNESLSDLIANAGWSPVYFSAGTTAPVQAGVMIGDSGGGEAAEYDEHIWTSPQNAARMVRALTDALCEKDGGNAGAYRENAAAYTEKLNALDGEFKKVVAGAQRKTIVFGDRFPFRYFADAYGLSYYAAFPGCSTETEPSAATVAF